MFIQFKNAELMIHYLKTKGKEFNQDQMPEIFYTEVQGIETYKNIRFSSMIMNEKGHVKVYKCEEIDKTYKGDIESSKHFSEVFSSAPEDMNFYPGEVVPD